MKVSFHKFKRISLHGTANEEKPFAERIRFLDLQLLTEKLEFNIRGVWQSKCCSVECWTTYWEMGQPISFFVQMNAAVSVGESSITLPLARVISTSAADCFHSHSLRGARTQVFTEILSCKFDPTFIFVQTDLQQAKACEISRAQQWNAKPNTLIKCIRKKLREQRLYMEYIHGYGSTILVGKHQLTTGKCKIINSDYQRKKLVWNCI